MSNNKVQSLQKLWLKQEIGNAQKQFDIAFRNGDVEKMNDWGPYRAACMDKLKEIDPTEEIDADKLMAQFSY